MSLKQQLQEDLKEALRARDARRKSVIRMALAAITNAEVEHGGELDDASVIAVLRKQTHRRQETIAELQQANRPEALADEEAELAILEGSFRVRRSPRRHAKSSMRSERPGWDRWDR
jgi:uncharacterized protein YqeY